MKKNVEVTMEYECVRPGTVYPPFVSARRTVGFKTVRLEFQIGAAPTFDKQELTELRDMLNEILGDWE